VLVLFATPKSHVSNLRSEYEAALQLAPESATIIQSVIAAHTLTGNFVRVRELQKLLPPGPALERAAAKFLRATNA